jgi:hypothetical protein
MSQGHFIRVIKRKEVLALSFGAMIGWSWVALTGGWIQEAGTLGAITAFAIRGITVILVGLTYAELAVALPTVVEYLAPDFSRGYLWTVAGWDVNAPQKHTDIGCIAVKPVRLSVRPLSPQISHAYYPPLVNPLIYRSVGGVAHGIRSFRCWSTYVGGGSSPLLGTNQI